MTYLIGNLVAFAGLMVIMQVAILLEVRPLPGKPLPELAATRSKRLGGRASG